MSLIPRYPRKPRDPLPGPPLRLEEVLSAIREERSATLLRLMEGKGMYVAQTGPQRTIGRIRGLDEYLERATKFDSPDEGFDWTAFDSWLEDRQKTLAKDVIYSATGEPEQLQRLQGRHDAAAWLRDLPHRTSMTRGPFGG